MEVDGVKGWVGGLDGTVRMEGGSGLLRSGTATVAHPCCTALCALHHIGGRRLVVHPIRSDMSCEPAGMRDAFVVGGFDLDAFDAR